MNIKQEKVLIMAGGTGGHIFPALSIAKQLQAKGAQVVWLGSVGGMEERIVKQAGLELFLIKSRPMRGGLKNLVLAPISISASLFSAFKIIRQQKITSVFGFGGFTTFAGGICAWLLRKPLFIHEQNSIMGLSNKVLAKFATKVFLAYPLKNLQANKKFINSANPVREEISQLALVPKNLQQNQPLNKATKQINILAFGGSLGALAINQTLPKAMQILQTKLQEQNSTESQTTYKINLLHQTGKDKLATTKLEYDSYTRNFELELLEFIEDMPEKLALADLGICRAGALTLAELSCAQIGAILIPYPHAVDNHQYYNAKFYADAGAGILLEQNQMTAEKLAQILYDLILDKTKLEELSKNMHKLSQPKIAQQIVDEMF